MLTKRTLRPVYVVGVGMHSYQRASNVPYTELGLVAIRAALRDCGVSWPVVESAYIGTAQLGVAVGLPMLRHLGSTRPSVVHVENASASGASAFRLAYLEVASGVSDVSIAIGVDKPSNRPVGKDLSNTPDLVGELFPPAAHFALFAERYMRETGTNAEQLAQVAVKNHRNGLLNPNAQRREETTLESVMSSAPIAGSLTKYQCCPVGEGAAAVIVASDPAIVTHQVNQDRAVRVAASVSHSEALYDSPDLVDQELTRDTTVRALAQAGVTPDDLDVVELHDAFAIEELAYIEAMGLSREGEAGRDLERGDFDIGGRCAVNPSGGLLSLGHPVGPTGLGQVAEITTQLRGEAGNRQHAHARVGLAHMLGVGAVCVEHVLLAPEQKG